MYGCSGCNGAAEKTTAEVPINSSFTDSLSVPPDSIAHVPPDTIVVEPEVVVPPPNKGVIAPPPKP